MMLPQDLAQQITELLPNLKCGPLKLYGRSFGRPGENALCLVSCEASGNCLRLHFEDDETVAIWNPADIQIDARTFRIGNATAIRWTYYYHDRPRTPENIWYRDYQQQDGSIAFRTNQTEVPGSGWLAQEALSSSALEIGLLSAVLESENRD